MARPTKSKLPIRSYVVCVQIDKEGEKRMCWFDREKGSVQHPAFTSNRRKANNFKKRLQRRNSNAIYTVNVLTELP